jgi:hypothetical protein
LEEKAAAPVYKAENTAVGIRHADYATPSITVGHHHRNWVLKASTDDLLDIRIIVAK